MQTCKLDKSVLHTASCKFCHTFTNCRDFRCNVDDCWKCQTPSSSTYDRWYFLEDYFWVMQRNFSKTHQLLGTCCFSPSIISVTVPMEAMNRVIITDVHTNMLNRSENCWGNARITNSEGDMVNGDQETRSTNSFVHLQIKSRFGHVLLLVRKATLACVWSSWPGMATSNMLGKRALRGAHWYHFCPPSVFTL